MNTRSHNVVISRRKPRTSRALAALRRRAILAPTEPAQGADRRILRTRSDGIQHGP